MSLPDYMPSPDAALVTDDEAAELVGVSPRTIRKWRSKHGLARFMDTPYTHTDDLFRCERERRRASTVPLGRLDEKKIVSTS